MIRARTGAAFSPIPPVNAIASSPPIAAIAEPACRTAQWQKCSMAKRLSGDPSRSSARMSEIPPDSPFRPLSPLSTPRAASIPISSARRSTAFASMSPALVPMLRPLTGE